MKVQIKFIALAIISTILMSFNPKDNSSSEDQIRTTKGEVTAVDNVNGCITIDRCNAGSFSVGWYPAFPGTNGGYPSVGQVIVIKSKAKRTRCSGEFLESWSVTTCD